MCGCVREWHVTWHLMSALAVDDSEVHLSHRNAVTMIKAK